VVPLSPLAIVNLGRNLCLPHTDKNDCEREGREVAIIILLFFLFFELFRYFNCTCARCRDPSELGSHVNTVRCPSCRHHTEGWVMPYSEDDWECRRCKRKMEEASIRAIVEPLLAETDRLAKTDR
jgi:hypothetical protein